jgi:hypothetical protein
MHLNRKYNVVFLSADARGTEMHLIFVRGVPGKHLIFLPEPAGSVSDFLGQVIRMDT